MQVATMAQHTWSQPGVAFPMVNHHRTVFMAEELGHGVCHPQFMDLEVVMLSIVQKVQAESIVGVKLE